jgi:hypothetical protein
MSAAGYSQNHDVSSVVPGRKKLSGVAFAKLSLLFFRTDDEGSMARNGLNSTRMLATGPADGP